MDTIAVSSRGGREMVAAGASGLIALRTDLRPGDLGAIVRLHGVTYAQEHGFDTTFEAYVAGPLSQFALGHTERDRLWIAEREGELVGCIAILGSSPTEAQLRWFLVAPAARGMGLGRRLLNEALAFAQGRGYQSVFLWTTSTLDAAARLYREAGFVKMGEKPGAWGVAVTEEEYLLRLGA